MPGLQGAGYGKALMAAALYAQMLTMSGLPYAVGQWLQNAELHFLVILTGYLLVVIVLGFFLDSVSIMLIVLPFVPTVSSPARQMMMLTNRPKLSAWMKPKLDWFRPQSSTQPTSDTNSRAVPSGVKSAGELFTVPVCVVMFVVVLLCRSCR